MYPLMIRDRHVSQQDICHVDIFAIIVSMVTYTIFKKCSRIDILYKTIQNCTRMNLTLPVSSSRRVAHVKACSISSGVDSYSTLSSSLQKLPSMSYVNIYCLQKGVTGVNNTRGLIRQYNTE